MTRYLSRLLINDDGPTTVEYAVIIALIVITCIGTVQGLATATRNSLDESANATDDSLGS